MARYIDLNERRSNAVIIKLRDKEFQIIRIVAGVRVKYSNYLKQVSELLNNISQVHDNAVLDDEVVSRYEDYASQVPDVLRSIIKLLLESNDLEFDAKWWEEEVDVEDMRNFIDAAISKDTTTMMHSKKKE